MTKKSTEIAEEIANTLALIDEKKETIKSLKEELKDLQEQYRAALVNEQKGQKEIDDYVPDEEETDLPDEEETDLPDEEEKTHRSSQSFGFNIRTDLLDKEEKPYRFRQSKNDIIEFPTPDTLRVECKGAQLIIDRETYRYGYTTGTCETISTPRKGTWIRDILFEATDFFKRPLDSSNVTQLQRIAQKRMPHLLAIARKQLSHRTAEESA